LLRRLRNNALKQFLRRFVIGIFWDEFAGEGLGVEGGRELVHLPARFGQSQLKLVGQRTRRSISCFADVI